jgi:hypothetical protein
MSADEEAVAKRLEALRAAQVAGYAKALAALCAPELSTAIQTEKCEAGTRLSETIERIRRRLWHHYATARRRKEPLSTAVTESTVQWLLHHRPNAQ